jgi:hypothetical protein
VVTTDDILDLRVVLSNYHLILKNRKQLDCRCADRYLKPILSELETRLLKIFSVWYCVCGENSEAVVQGYFCVCVKCSTHVQARSSCSDALDKKKEHDAFRYLLNRSSKLLLNLVIWCIFLNPRSHAMLLKHTVFFNWLCCWLANFVWGTHSYAMKKFCNQSHSFGNSCSIMKHRGHKFM